MYAVLVLGEAVGYSSCQAAVMVSGLWGVLYFGEAPRGKLQWFGGAVACTGGIVLLALVKG
jgi:glucose uptake protein GlcU